MRQETEGPQAVIDRDQDHAALAIGFAVKFLFMAKAAHERAAVDPESHRQHLPLLRGPNVQIQAVLGNIGLVLRLIIKFLSVERIFVFILHAAVGKTACGTNAFPGLQRHRRVPAQRAYGRLGVRNAKEDAAAILFHALQDA